MGHYTTTGYFKGTPFRGIYFLDPSGGLGLWGSLFWGSWGVFGVSLGFRVWGSLWGSWGVLGFRGLFLGFRVRSLFGASLGFRVRSLLGDCLRFIWGLFGALFGVYLGALGSIGGLFGALGFWGLWALFGVYLARPRIDGFRV